MTDLSDLIERVRAATGPDRVLSRDVLVTVGGWSYEKRGRDRQPWMYGPKGERKDPPGTGVFHAPHVTASVDAITALIEAKLPGWQYGSERRRDMNGGASGWVAPNEDANRAHAATEPLARTLAFLLAVQATGAK